MVIGDWMARGELYHPEATAVVDVAKGPAGRFTYRELNARANRLAAHLRDAAGVQRGDRVALLAHNGVEVLDALFACCKLGAIFVPLSWRAHPRELADAVALTAPRALIAGAAFAPAAAQLVAARPLYALAIGACDPVLPGARDYDDVVAAGPAPAVACSGVREEDIACLLFTGGTTGPAKAAQISYRMIAWNTLSTVIHELARGDVTLTHTPMFHTGGLLVYTLPLLTLGGTVVIMQRWTADEMLELIDRERVTVLFCVPTQYQAMLQSPRFASARLGSLRFLTSGGAPLPVPVLHAYRAAHGVVLKQGFGMTEFGPGLFSLAAADAERRAGSIGKPNYFVDAEVHRDDGTPCAPDEVGELVLRGPSGCSGYFGDEAASRAAVDAAGWFHTGDLARVDRDGFYYIAGRKKDMFISGGENVYPLEVERALDDHAAVAQCAVIGVPDARWGEVGCAVVVLREGAEATAAELIAHCADRLARFKVPRSVWLVDALPLTAAGKVDKRELLLRFAGAGRVD
jgi:fatty-acyl-CoA synthase